MIDFHRYTRCLMLERGPRYVEIFSFCGGIAYKIVCNNSKSIHYTAYQVDALKIAQHLLTRKLHHAKR